MNMHKGIRKELLLKILLFSVGATVGAFVRVWLPADELVVHDQPAGTTVFVRRLKLAKAGYIILRPVSQDGSLMAPSVSDYLPSGMYTDMNVDIMGDGLRVAPGNRLAVEVWEDNGDAFYDHELEIQVRRLNGKTLSKTITFY